MSDLPLGIEPLTLEDPFVLGGRRLRGRIGAGGMGIVYLAGEPGEYVAIKTLPATDLDDPTAHARFRAEAACTRRIDSPRIPRVLVDGSAEAHPFLVIDYVAGPSLEDVVCGNGPLAPPILHALALSVLEALIEIHRAHIVHRDLKPSNLLLSDAGPKIIDFGLAHQEGRSDGMTETGMVMGSPGWIAPERLSGGSATAASDVFCWGMLVAYAATGRHPFGEGSSAARARQVMRLAPDLDGVPSGLRDCVSAALAKDPGARPTAAALHERVRDLPPEAADAPHQIARSRPVPLLDDSGRDRRGRSPLLAAAACGIAALFAVLVWQRAGDSSATPQVIVSTAPGPTLTVPSSPRPSPVDRDATTVQRTAAPPAKAPPAPAAKTENEKGKKKGKHKGD